MKLAYHLLTIHLLLLCLSFSPLAAKAFSGKTDKAALLSFKSQIHADPLKALSSWNDSLHHCQWQGVVCSRHHADRVTGLVLDSKQLSGYISLSLANLTFLQTIILSDNHLQGEIPIELGDLHRLRVVNLTMNNFGGSIPYSLGKLTNLEHLDLSQNNLSGSVPLVLGNLTKLSLLHLSKNSLTGHIPPALGNLTNLLYLYLDRNKISGTIPSALSDLNNIEDLSLFENRLSGFIPDALGKLQNILVFDIYNNSITGEIPHSIYNISTMVKLSLGNNHLEGTLPLAMCDTFSNLQSLYLYDNRFTGLIPPSISNCSALVDFELDLNNFSGEIPSTIGSLKNLKYITAGSNQLEAKRDHDWSFIDALTNCTYLQELYVDRNQLQGVMPSSIANLSTSLLYLSLFGNPVSGSIPIGLGKLTNLVFLNLEHMLLTGIIPVEIGYLSKLEVLDISSNSLSGQIPQTFGNLTEMSQLFLCYNTFEGSIPPELVNMQILEALDLSNNKLIGKIPKEIMDIPLTIYLDLSHNHLTDNLPPEIGNFRNLQLIFLSNNKLHGDIPSTIDGCQLLQELHLNNNFFHGIIPFTLSNLRGLQVLDVSNNNFSGQVPKSIAKMNLYYLNISFNNFEGELPREGIFKNTSGFDAQKNYKLCGGVPELHLSPCTPKSSTHSHQSLQKIVLASTIVSCIICLAIVIWLLITRYSKKRPSKNQQSDGALKHEVKPVSYNDLFRATKNFSSENLIGKGTFGTVYKADMNFDNMTTVAVKVLNLEKYGSSRSFFSECEALRNVRHRNLIKVLSLCSSVDHQGNDFKALVFEFMPNGSLAEWLHPNIDWPFRTLNLIQRLNIAIDVALALEYLHYYGSTPIVHCDIKPSNVLLNDDMIAHVSDFGLARILVQPDIPPQLMTDTDIIKGSIGYIPPEYGMGYKPSIEGDVYSYGILLLEMFTGVSPTDERFGDKLNLQKYVEMAFPEHIMDIVDTRLFPVIEGKYNPHTPENIFGCLISVIQCGFFCIKESPKERISSKDVVKELGSARKKLLGRFIETK